MQIQMMPIAVIVLELWFPGVKFCFNRKAMVKLGSVMKKQKVLVLYLTSSALDSRVIGWAQYDGSNQQNHMSGDSETPPYASGLAALKDGWRLIQASPLLSHTPGREFNTDYLKYEFFFEKLVTGKGRPHAD